LRQFQTNKNFQTIVNLCFCIVRYVLYQAGKSHLLNLIVEQGVHGSQSSACSLRRGERADSEGERASSLNSQHSGTCTRPSSKQAMGMSSIQPIAYQGSSKMGRADSGKLPGSRSTQPGPGQSMNASQGALTFANNRNGPSGHNFNNHSSGAGQSHGRLTANNRKRSPRQHLKDSMQATINRLSTPKQLTGGKQAQAAGSAVSQALQPGPQKSAEQPQSKALQLRPQAYEEEEHRKLYQAPPSGTDGLASRTPVVHARRPTDNSNQKSRSSAQKQRSQHNPPQRAMGGPCSDKFSSVKRHHHHKAAGAFVDSQYLVTPVRAEHTAPAGEASSYVDQMSLALMQRNMSPHEVYQQSGHKNSDHHHLRPRMGTEKSSSSAKNIRFPHSNINSKTQSDLAPSNRQPLGSNQKLKM